MRKGAGAAINAVGMRAHVAARCIAGSRLPLVGLHVEGGGGGRSEPTMVPRVIEAVNHASGGVHCASGGVAGAGGTSGGIGSAAGEHCECDDGVVDAGVPVA